MTVILIIFNHPIIISQLLKDNEQINLKLIHIIIQKMKKILVIGYRSKKDIFFLLQNEIFFVL